MATVDITRIDKEIIEQKKVLLNLYTRRNSLVPIHRLPTETLTAIFILCACEFYHSENAGSFSSSVPSWVNISYVCRHWRDASTNCPTLWSYFFFRSLRWTEELLTRTKQTSLKLKINADVRYGGIPHHIFEPVADHVERIEELYLRLPHSNSSTPFLSTFLSTPAPRLQKLEIRTLSEPIKLFEGYTPVLHTLELSFCSFPWHSFTLSSLKTLILRDIPPQSSLCIVELLGILGCMPCLNHLDLFSALASARDTLSSATYATPPKVTLSRIAHITIIAPLSTIVMLLSSINIPPKAQLTLIQDYGEDPLFDEYNQLFSLLSRRFSEPGDLALAVPMIRSLAVHVNPESKELIFSASEQISYNPQKQGPRFLLEVTLTLLDEEQISDICHSIPPTNLQSLLFIGSDYSMEVWRQILEQFANLRHIQLDGGFIPCDFGILLTMTPYAYMPDEHDQGPAPKHVPFLEMLELHGVCLSAREDAEDCLIGLEDALSIRTESRCRFTMTGCWVVTSIGNVTFDSVGWWEDDTFMVTSYFDGDGDDEPDSDSDEADDSDEEES